MPPPTKYATRKNTRTPTWLLIRQREEFRENLASRNFTHHVTLATNHDTARVQVMRRRLKLWDAMVNGDLLGGRWSQRPDERLFWIAFAEKLELNSHWHLLIQVDAAPRSPAVADRLALLPSIAQQAWRKIQPRGTIDVQRIDSQGEIRYKTATDYATKALAQDRNFDEFIVCREFWSK